MDLYTIGSQAGVAEGNAAAGPTQDLGREEFLRLFLTQLQAQDPMDPMKSEDFTAQLAQFSTLEQMFNSNGHLEELIGLQTSSMSLSAASLLGETVFAEGNSVQAGAVGPVDLMYRLEDEAVSTIVTVFNGAGEPVAVLSGAGGAGDQRLRWDGLDTEGNRVPAGNYRFNVRAMNGAGQDVVVSTRMAGTVERVSFEGGQPYVTVNGRQLPVEAILEIEKNAG